MTIFVWLGVTGANIYISTFMGQCPDTEVGIQVKSYLWVSKWQHATCAALRKPKAYLRWIICMSWYAECIWRIVTAHSAAWSQRSVVRLQHVMLLPQQHHSHHCSSKCFGQCGNVAYLASMVSIWHQHCQHVSGVMFCRPFAGTDHDRTNITVFSTPMEASRQHLKAKTGTSWIVCLSLVQYCTQASPNRQTVFAFIWFKAP